MSDDLVKWLREVAVEMRVVGMGQCEEAADRIEELEAALRKIAALGFWDGDSAMGIARKALEGKKDG